MIEHSVAFFVFIFPKTSPKIKLGVFGDLKISFLGK